MESVRGLAESTAPLTAKFGDRLTLSRDGNVAQWSYSGQSALVELRADGTIEATYVGQAVVDAVSTELVSPVYCRRGGHVYRMTAEGCSRMVADIMEFFSGTREPGFTFVATSQA